MSSKTETDLSQLLSDIAEINTQIAALQALKAKLQDEAMAEMQSRSVTKWSAGNGQSATLVQGTTVEIDESGLINSLSPQQVDDIMVVVVDRAKLESAVADGRIPIEVVAEHSTEKPRKPHLRFGRSSRD